MKNSNWLLQTQEVSWRHYVWAFVVSLLAPLLVICFQSAVMKSRGFLPDKAMLYESTGGAAKFGSWLWANKMWIGTVAITAFLILCPFLKFRILRWVIFAIVLAGWTYLFCR
jgi:hypothetical protein